MNRWRIVMTQFHEKYRKKMNDRGSAIVLVIIAMAMIGILATTMLWMAYMNYMIKLNDIRNKNSFYSAEVLVEQIMAGLQTASSEAVGAAYKDMVAKWDSLESEENRYGEFAESYMDNLAKILCDSYTPGVDKWNYSRDKLKLYIDAALRDESSAASGMDMAAWNNGNKVGEPEKKPVLEKVNNNSLILHDIYVSYTDGNGLVSIVQTDICIDVPKLVFTHNEIGDEIYDYVLVGNQGIEVNTGGGTATTEGSVYAGADEHGKGGLKVDSPAKLVMEGAEKVIVKGDIYLDRASGLTVRDVPKENNRVYAQNIYLDSATVSLDSDTYVANDLSLNGSGSKATLTKGYYGYGTSAYNGLTGEPAIDTNDSSAIIINGRNSTIDMSGIRRLLIAGRAYIGQYSTADNKKNGIMAGAVPAEPVMMGESIAVKGGQIAYLVPPECIGTMDNETIYGHNPISGTKVTELEQSKIDYGDKFHEVDFTKKVYKLGNKSLSEFGVTSMKNIRTINAQYNGGTLRYYYLVMNKEDAAKYFVQYYDFTASKNVLDGYFDKYASGGIQLGDYAATTNQYTILGNSLISSALSESGVTLLTAVDQSTLMPDAGSGGTEGDAGEGGVTPPAGGYQEVEENALDDLAGYQFQSEAEVEAFATTTKGVYQALTTNLSEDPSTINPDPAAGQNVFNSLIKETDVENYLNSHGAMTVKFYTEIDEVTGVKKGQQAVVTKEPDFVLSSQGGDSSDIRLIIAFGDVTIDKNYKGLVIAKGKVTVENGASSIRRDKMGLYKVLSAKSGITGDTITPLDMFIDGSGSMINGATDARVDDAGNLQINYSEIVRYMNWIKK